jgi:hypothetical protein
MANSQYDLDLSGGLMPVVRFDWYGIAVVIVLVSATLFL